jgi:phospholipid/cholesterol/gamma-HCH transport system substrate-binding protein
LRNTNKMTEQFASAAPQVERTMAELQVTLRESSEALDAFEKVMGSTDQLLNKEGQSLAVELRKTLGSASNAAQSLSDTLEDTRPAARQLTDTTLPAAEAALRDLQATSKALRKVTEQIETQGASSLLGGPKLPDYEE